ncbi:hypothetical protein HUU62_07090 [Rhodoferax sp. 4810]|nr:hypothetical protein [Thiospirillum jenense]MBB1074179.1 hypothetical protein [Rhodoferax jenense]
MMKINHLTVVAGVNTAQHWMARLSFGIFQQLLLFQWVTAPQGGGV